MRNVSWAVNQYIIMISERSCDTENWSNDAENTDFIYRNKLQFTMYPNRKELFEIVKIFSNASVFTVFFIK